MNICACGLFKCVRPSVTIALLAGFSVCSSSPANAEPITFSFAGEITSFSLTNETPDPFGGAIRAGTLFFGGYTFDPAATDTKGSNPTDGFYASHGSPYGVWVTVAGFDFYKDWVDIYTANQPGVDHYVFLNRGPNIVSTVMGDFYANWQVWLTDPTGSALSDDTLTTTAPDLQLFSERREFLLSGSGPEIGYVTMLGTVNTMELANGPVAVPEPATLTLFGGALVALGAASRRRA